MHSEMQTLAAIDIGSNSCRLKIVGVQDHRLKMLYQDREITRLGSSVFSGGMISPDAMADTLRALKRFYKAVHQFGAKRVRAVATAAVRNARNGQIFAAWVKAETGWDLEIISGLEEARLIHRGVMREAGTRGRCLLIDLGGGSCEITLSQNRRILETASLPLGAVRLTQEFLRGTDPPTAESISRMRQLIRRELARGTNRFTKLSRVNVIATSGTAAALAEAGMALIVKPKKGKLRNRGSRVATTSEVHRLASRLQKMTNAKRSQMPGIGPRRSEIIVAGAIVYAELLEHLGLPGFRYSDLGLRDGMIAQMLAEQNTRTSVHHRFEQDRWEGVLETCRRFGVDARYAEPVRARVVQLFDDLQSLHKLPADYRRWLEVAAMMRDVGKYISYQGHHHHTQYIISSSELFGFTPGQRAIISGIARYIGKSRPATQDRAFRYIVVTEHENVRRAIMLLRLAVALNQNHASDVAHVKTRVAHKWVKLELRPGRTGADLEVWSLRKEGDYFREVFRRDLLVALV